MTDPGDTAAPGPQLADSGLQPYAELKRRVQAAGLLSRRPGYYVLMLVTNALAFGTHKIGRAYCAELGVPYHATTIYRAYHEILSFIHEVNTPLRQGFRVTSFPV